MVECEFVYFAIVICSLSCFNRYMVECEFVYKDSVSDVVNGFNRYMVECELFCVGTERQGRTVLIDTW